jgi:hypothetical protein
MHEIYFKAYLRGVYANIYTGTISFFSLYPLNVDDKLFPVNLNHLSNLLAFVMASDNLSTLGNNLTTRNKN